MLKQIKIKNYAIINDLEVDFDNGLNILTGETGAGKSIIIGALSLLLGERADLSVLIDKQKKCIIEGIFIIKNRDILSKLFKENDWDWYDELNIRREINPQGNSRAFVNDTPANLKQLQSLSTLLVDLHQQFDHLEIQNESFQFDVVDAMANIKNTLRVEYNKHFQEWQVLNSEISALEIQKNNFSKEQDYKQFVYNEIKSAHFQKDEIEIIEQKMNLLEHSEEIQLTLSEIIYQLTQSENNISDQLKLMSQRVQKLAKVNANLMPLNEQLTSSSIELKEISTDLQTELDKIEINPKELELIRERFDIGYRLLKKNGLQNTSELIELKSQLEIDLQSSLDIEDRLNKLKNQRIQQEELLKKIAKEISVKRTSIIPELINHFTILISKVGMEKCKFRIDLNPTQFNKYGGDHIQFLMDANNRDNFQLVGKAASGGELSRIMLCLKSLIAENIDLPCLIFDEIDTGISGEPARQVGQIIKSLSNFHQVICITHQPSIAAKGDTHFFIYKQPDENNALQTAVRLLNKEEREYKIAEMIGGENIDGVALENARKLMMN